ncbi:hypothetical protein GCM10010300_79130 [Streptomyces olivaceoviridis]|nr:hypothetical protein GCM10010300_79130 [Streptomyces olivaceoviridis]
MGWKGPASGPEIGDAFGQVLTACWEGGMRPGTVHEVLERDDGYVQVWDAARWFAGPDEWSAAERWGCEHVIGRVLDVGCGAGRHAIPLAEAGHEVIGIDCSPGAVAVARDRGVRALRTAVEELAPDEGPFDSILLLGSNLGILVDEQQAARSLTRLASMAGAGARLIGSSLDPHITGYPEHRRYHSADHQRSNRRTRRLPGQTRMRVRYRRTVTEWFDYTFFSEAELERILKGTPWVLRAMEYDGPAYCVVLELR